MDFTCPHCHKTFSAKIRKGATSAKANEARRRNGKLGGRARKLSDAELATIFRSRETWTGGEFHAAIENKIGQSYSRTQAFLHLRWLRAFKGERARLVSEVTAIDKVPVRKAATSGKKKLAQSP